MSRDFIKIMLNLTLICLFVGVLVGTVYTITQPQIVKVQKEQREQTRKHLLPGASTFTEKKMKGKDNEGKETEFIVSEGLDGEGKPIGYIVDTESTGYSSKIRIMFSVDKAFDVQKVVILSQGETPGLGALIMKDKFLMQFGNKNKEKLIVKRNENPYENHEEFIAGLTGATISSEAVASGIRLGLEALIKESRELNREASESNGGKHVE